MSLCLLRINSSINHVLGRVLVTDPSAASAIPWQVQIQSTGTLSVIIDVGIRKEREEQEGSFVIVSWLLNVPTTRKVDHPIC